MQTTAKERTYELYLNAFYRTAHTYKGEQCREAKPYIKKLVTYGIKMINTKQEPTRITEERALWDFNFAELILDLIGMLTPREFMNMYPIIKDYDGDKHQCKDYFYTRDYIRSLPIDKPIIDTVPVIGFLWEYHNWETRIFLVNVTGYIDILRRLEGQPTMMESFCKENNIRTYRSYTDGKDKQFIVDCHTGKSFRIKKALPHYLRPVKRKDGEKSNKRQKNNRS